MGSEADKAELWLGGGDSPAAGARASAATDRPEPPEPDRRLGAEHLSVTQRIAATGSAEINLVTREARWSGELYRLTGRDPARGAPDFAEFLSHVHPDDRDRVRAKIARDMRGEAVGPFTFRFLRPYGAVCWLERHSEPHRDPASGAVKLVEVYRDLTDRKRLETELRARDEALRRNRDHLELAQHIARVGSIERDLRTGRVTLSDEIYRLLDLEPGSARATLETMAAHVHPDDLELIAELHRKAWAGEDVPPVEYRLIRPDGAIRWIRRESAITRDAEGRPVISASTMLDITERKQMESELSAGAERLRRSEEHLRRAQRVGMIGSSEYVLGGREHHWSENYFRLLGYEPGEVPACRDSFLRAIAPEDHAKLDDFATLLAKDGPIPPLELRALRKDGGVRWLHRQVEILRGADGKPTHMVFTLQDISDRKRMEAALIDSADEARRVREHLVRAQRVGKVGSSEADLATGEQYWSDEFFRLLGLEPGAVTPGRDAFVGMIVPEDRGKLISLDTFEQDFAGRPIPAAELRVRLADGELRWLRRQVEVMRDPQGRATHLLFTLQDITESRRLDQALIDSADAARRSREHLARAQRIARIGSIEIDPRARTSHWSDELYDMLGLDKRVAPSLEAFMSRVHPDDLAGAKEDARTLLAGRAIEPAALRVVRPDGEARWLYRVAEIIGGPDRKPEAIVVTLTDITEIRRAQEEQARLQEQLAHVQKLDSLGALSGGIAHDFNNLLTAILGSAGLLRDDPSLSPEARRRAQGVLRAAEQGAELTRQLLSFGRRQMLNPVALDLATVAHDLELLLRPTLGEEIDLSIAAAPAAWPVTADKNQLETAIINLAVNARDAMPQGGALHIEFANRTFDDEFVTSHAGAMRGDYVAISVADTGGGMTQEVLARAFEPFFTTKPEGRGTGLGLAMVYGFAKQSGGYTEVRSQPGDGTRVTIYLPRGACAREEEKPAKPAKPPAKAAKRGSLEGGEHILLVEDDPLVREFVEDALGRLGYRVTVKSNAAGALTALAKAAAPVDLLLTDLMLPGGMNGGELAAEAARRQPGLRVLFASGYTEDALIRQGRLAPGQNLIPKPFDSDQLALKVREALDDEPRAPAKKGPARKAARRR